VTDVAGLGRGPVAPGGSALSLTDALVFAVLDDVRATALTRLSCASLATARFAADALGLGGGRLGGEGDAALRAASDGFVEHPAGLHQRVLAGVELCPYQRAADSCVAFAVDHDPAARCSHERREGGSRSRRGVDLIQAAAEAQRQSLEVERTE
jgi:hypothetical protein